jgi:PKD repeat protein
MPNQQRVRRRSSLAAASCLLLALLLAGSAGAEGTPPGYGELTRFGEGGVGVGKLNTERVDAIGVDPRDNSFYVLDEPETPDHPENPATGEFVRELRHLRLQKFTAVPVGSTHYVVAASVSFNQLSPSGGREEVGERSVEGIAVDPKLERVYVLAVDLRGGETKLHVDVEQPAASTLYAYSTNLAPAKGTKEIEVVVGKAKELEKAVLTGPTELGTQSATIGKALLRPAGITVDPGNGDVIVLGHVDTVGEEADEFESEGDHYVLQRIHAANGELGKRYVDTSNFLKFDNEEEREEFLEADSPVVTSSAGTEHLYVNDAARGLVEVPLSFEGSPRLFSPVHQGGVLEGALVSEHGAQVSVGSSAGAGAAPEGPIYTGESIKNAAIGQNRAGLLALSGLDGSELGWSGGQSLQSTSGAHCVIQGPGLSVAHEAGVSPIAAGSEGKVFVLAREFLEPIESTLYPAVIEFGPGGSGCPTAAATTPVAKVNEQIVENVQPEQVVTLTSNVTQANVLKTEWDFGDGTTETVGVGGSACPGTQAPQCPHVQHTYASAGTFTVTEKLYHDDLASTSPIVATGRVVVAGALPKALASGPVALATNQEGEFDGSASSEPARGVNQISKYEWDFGDGQRETKTEPTAWHAYSTPGSYTVSLTVTDTAGATSVPYRLPLPVTVTQPTAPGGVVTSPRQGVGPSVAGGVAGSKVSQTTAPVPDVRLVGRSLRAALRGSLQLTLSCPAAEKSCSGSVTLRTLATGTVGHGARKKAAVPALTLASAKFSLQGGHHKTITVRLSARARTLLARAHVLRAHLSILAHDPAGASHTNQTTVTVRG